MVISNRSISVNVLKETKNCILIFITYGDMMKFKDSEIRIPLNPSHANRLPPQED